MNDIKKEWRLLVDHSGAIAVDDPTGSTYTFVFVVNGKIVKRGESYSGFNNNAKSQLKMLLNNQLKALEMPTIQEIKQTKIVEMD